MMHFTVPYDLMAAHGASEVTTVWHYINLIIIIVIITVDWLCIITVAQLKAWVTAKMM